MSLDNYILEDSFEIPNRFDDYFLDKNNNVYLLSDNALLVLKEDFVKIDTCFIEKIIQINTNNYVAFYYKSRLALFCKLISEEKEEEREILKSEDEFDFFVNESEEVFIWQGNKLKLVINKTVHSATLLFEIKDVKPSSCDELVLLDTSLIMYLFDTINLKVISGIKSVSKNVICYDSSTDSNLFALFAHNTLYILDLLAKKKVKEIYKPGISFINFYKENTLLIKTDHLYEIDLLTDTTHKVLENNFETLKIYSMNNGYSFIKPQKEVLVEKEQTLNTVKEELTITNELLSEVEIKNLNLKTEFYKIIFEIKDEIELIKEKIDKLEKIIKNEK